MTHVYIRDTSPLCAANLLAMVGDMREGDRMAEDVFRAASARDAATAPSALPVDLAQSRDTTGGLAGFGGTPGTL